MEPMENLKDTKSNIYFIIIRRDINFLKKSVMEIMEEFFTLRLTYYSKRKDYLLSKLIREVEIL